MLNVRTMKNRMHTNRHAVMTDSGVMFVPANIYRSLVSCGNVSDDTLVVKKEQESNVTREKTIYPRRFCR